MLNSISNMDDTVGTVFDNAVKQLSLNASSSYDSFTQLITDLQASFNTAEAITSPLILDLDGDGIETINKTAGIHFDHDGNHFAETTGWVGKDDGLLVWDRNSNGKIDNGGELFGNQTLLANGSKATNGFAALAELDSNSDGKIDTGDAAFSQLRVWKDGDSNAIVSDGELLSLNTAGVQSLGIAFTAQTQTDAQGNQHLQAGQYTRTDGRTRALTDVWFSADMARTVDQDIVAVNSTIAALPELQGFGNVHSLHQAMARDTTGHLQSLVTSFASETNPVARSAIMTTLLYAWAGVEGIDPASRSSAAFGNTIGDARKLATLEAFLGDGFIGTGSDAANPIAAAASVLIDAFNMLSYRLSSQLMAQTHFKSLYDSIGLIWNGTTSSFDLDVTAVVSALQTRYAADPVSGLQWMQEFGQNLVANGDFGVQTVTALRQQGSSTGEGFALHLSQLGWTLVSGDVNANTLYGEGYQNYQLLGLDGNDQLNGNKLEDILEGGAGNDQLLGNAGNDILKGGTDTDHMEGGAGGDTYIFALGDGQDTINDNGNKGNIDTLKLTGLMPSQITLLREVIDGVVTTALLVKINGTTDQIRIQNHFSGSASAIEKIIFDDGTVWDAAVLNTAPAVLSQAGTVRGTEAIDVFDLRNAVSNTVSGAYSGYDSGNDTYIFGVGSGQDTISDYGNALGNIDTIRLAGLTPSQVTLAREIENGIASNNLLVKVNGTNDQLRIQDQFYGSSHAIEKIVFDDGTIWDAAVINTAPITPTVAGSVRGSYGADLFDLGNAVNNTVSGAYSGYDSGNDTYIFGTGSGEDTILDYGTAAGNIDTIRIAGLTPSQVTLAREVDNGIAGNNLLVKVNGTNDHVIEGGDKMFLANQFYGLAGQVRSA